MEKEKARFLKGAEDKSVTSRSPTKSSSSWPSSPAYGFNKSHSAAYGLVTYQTGYLKKFFPEEFLAGPLTCDKEDTDKVVKNVGEVRAIGIEVRSPT